MHFDRGIRGLFDGVYSEINEKNGSKTIVWTTLHFDSNEICLKDQAFLLVSLLQEVYIYSSLKDCSVVRISHNLYLFRT